VPAAAGGQASTAGYYSTSTAFLEALAEAGVSYVFANLGTDHPGLIEAYARAQAEGREDAFPQLIICPHETVALSAAHAYASVTRQPQAVIVHVDGGTQNLGGEVSNAMRGHIPVLIFAGASPFTLDGELPGSRRLARSEGERNDQLATYRSSRSSCSCHGGVFHLFRHRATASRSLARYQRLRYEDTDVY